MKKKIENVINKYLNKTIRLYFAKYISHYYNKNNS